MTQVVDSKQRKLDPQELIAIAIKETGGDYTPEQVTAFIGAESSKFGALTVRFGNTLFIVTPFPNNPKQGMFRALNADTARNYIENGKEFVKVCAEKGFTAIVTQFKDKTILNVFKAISKNPPLKGMGYAVQKTEDGGYQVTVNLGTTPEGGLPEPALQTPVNGGLQ